MAEKTENLDRLKLSVVSPSRSLFEGTVDYVQVPSFDGLMGIRPGHATLLGMLGYGILTFPSNEGEKRYVVDGGFLEVSHNVVTVLANNAERIEDVDSDGAFKELKQSLKEIAIGDDAIEARYRKQQSARIRLKNS